MPKFRQDGENNSFSKTKEYNMFILSGHAVDRLNFPNLMLPFMGRTLDKI